MLALYSVSTRRLSAFGCGVGESHQTRVNESLTRTRRTVTHSAGVGSRAGLKQMNSWQRCRFAASWKASSALRLVVDIVGVPWFQPLPTSMTIEPSAVKYSAQSGAYAASHSE